MAKFILKKHRRFSLIFLNNKFYIRIYNRIFFVQEAFELKKIWRHKRSFMTKFWFFYVLKVLFHFGMISLNHCNFFNIYYFLMFYFRDAIFPMNREIRFSFQTLSGIGF